MTDVLSLSLETLVARVDRDRWQATREKWEGAYMESVARGEKPDRIVRHAYNYAKYFNLEQWIRYHMQCLAHLRLNAGPRPLHVLDIGCGSGIFSFLCNQFGHRAEGLDIESPMYSEMAEILGVPLFHYTIQPKTPLPDDIRGYDVFSAISIKFDREDFGTNRTIPWDLSEWRFLIEDLAGRLNPGGRIYIKPNSFNGVVGFGNQEVSDYLASVADEVVDPLAYVIGRDRVLKGRKG